MTRIALDIDRMQAEHILRRMDDNAGLIVYVDAPNYLKYVNPLLRDDQMAELTKIVRGYLEDLIEDINQELNGGKDGNS